MKYKVQFLQKDHFPVESPGATLMAIEVRLCASDAINAIKLAKAELDEPDEWTPIDVVRVHE